MMEPWQRAFYYDMMKKGRACLVREDKELVACIAFFVGDDDIKFLHARKPWTVIDDDPNGETFYIDQFISANKSRLIIPSVVRSLVEVVQEIYPNLKRVKWARAPVHFRKHNIRRGVPHVYCKNIT